MKPRPLTGRGFFFFWLDHQTRDRLLVMRCRARNVTTWFATRRPTCGDPLVAPAVDLRTTYPISSRRGLHLIK
jgi:hypothetical protein